MPKKKDLGDATGSSIPSSKMTACFLALSLTTSPADDPAPSALQDQTIDTARRRSSSSSSSSSTTNRKRSDFGSPGLRAPSLGPPTNYSELWVQGCREERAIVASNPLR
ncbi:hypothetical protein E4U40_007424 [Claviceps sp. LM458 group G5]|nr:hypothetical protein E4U40_007424 [Claviceps sp. LM458 group G5]